MVAVLRKLRKRVITLKQEDGPQQAEEGGMSCGPV
jgi:hypothetical protein